MGRPAAARRSPQLDEPRAETTAETCLHEIFHNADVIGSSRAHHKVFLLVSLDVDRFDQLCQFGAEWEDLEDNADREDERCDDEPEPDDDDDDAERDYLCAPVPDKPELPTVIVGDDGRAIMPDGSPVQWMALPGERPAPRQEERRAGATT